jgi:hypothetical protein
MEWLHREFNKREQELNAREAAVSAAPAVYAELWEQILKVAKEANTLRFNLKTNGGPRNRKVIKDDRELILELSADSSTINAFSPGGSILSFELKADEGDVVHLTNGGKQVDYASAAEWIMKPFLFPGPKI